MAAAPPVITSTAAVAIGETDTLSHRLIASEPVTWSIVAGADRSRFRVVSAITLGKATSNKFVVTVRAKSTRTGRTADQTITVTETAGTAPAPTPVPSTGFPFSSATHSGLAALLEDI